MKVQAKRQVQAPGLKKVMKKRKNPSGFIIDTKPSVPQWSVTIVENVTRNALGSGMQGATRERRKRQKANWREELEDAEKVVRLYVHMPKMIKSYKEVHSLHPDIVRVKKPKVRYSRFCYVYAKDDEGAQRVMADLNGKWLGNGKVVVAEPQEVKKEDKLDHTRLFVSGIPNSATKEDLKKLFPDSASVFIVHRPKSDQQYGFVSFKDSAAALAAMAGRHMIQRSKIQVTLAKKNDRIEEKKKKWRARKKGCK